MLHILGKVIRKHHECLQEHKDMAACRYRTVRCLPAANRSVLGPLNMYFALLSPVSRLEQRILGNVVLAGHVRLQDNSGTCKSELTLPEEQAATRGALMFEHCQGNQG